MFRGVDGIARHIDTGQDARRSCDRHRVVTLPFLDTDDLAFGAISGTSDSISRRPSIPTSATSAYRDCNASASAAADVIHTAFYKFILRCLQSSRRDALT